MPTLWLISTLDFPGVFACESHAWKESLLVHDWDRINCFFYTKKHIVRRSLKKRTERRRSHASEPMLFGKWLSATPTRPHTVANFSHCPLQSVSSVVAPLPHFRLIFAWGRGYILIQLGLARCARPNAYGLLHLPSLSLDFTHAWAPFLDSSSASVSVTFEDTFAIQFSHLDLTSKFGER